MTSSLFLFSGDGNVSFEEFVEIVSNIGANETASPNQDQEEKELRDAFRVRYNFLSFPLCPLATGSIHRFNKITSVENRVDTASRARDAFDDSAMTFEYPLFRPDIAGWFSLSQSIH